MIPANTLMLGGLSALLALGAADPARADFQSCVKSFWPAAKRAGVSWETFEKATAGITLDKEVIESANYQPEYKKPVGEYVDRAISPKRLATGKEKLVEYGPLLDQLSRLRPTVQSAVPDPERRAAFWERLLDSDVLDRLRAGDEAGAISKAEALLQEIREIK